MPIIAASLLALLLKTLEDTNILDLLKFILRPDILLNLVSTSKMACSDAGIEIIFSKEDQIINKKEMG